MLPFYAYPQDNANTRLFLDVPPDTFITHADSALDSLRLPDQFIIPRSERIYRNDFKLMRGIHYRFNARKGAIFFSSPLNETDSLTVIYQKYPFPLVAEYYHRELKAAAPGDSLAEKGEVASVVQTRLWDEIDSFSGNLQRSGSIVRGVEIGSNRDLTLNSGLNLQLSGYITPDVQLVAALTDESTPIQPEGNTQTLREVDKVFVKIISPHLGGTLGDFNLAYQNSLFGNFKRKLQGITSYSKFGDHTQQVTYATSRGTFHTNQFLGQEGNQGPYQLVGKNGEREIIVLAGTERVYINGQQQVRGENNDYIIDYSLGQLTFTNHRLITSEDRIEVDFEYANNFQRYGKSLLGVSASRVVQGSGLGYDVRLFREWDDTRNLLEDSSPLTDQEKAALAAAGDDPFKAGVDGATFAGAGLGNYTKSDTTIAGNQYIYFKYTGPNAGDYSVSFSGVGSGNGNYIKERLGVYRFVGPGQGDYLPIRLVPLAGDKKLGDFALTYHAGQHFSVSGETAISNFDQNIFSGLNDANNTGQAHALGAGYSNRAVRLFGKSVGALEWKLNWKNRQDRYSLLDRQYQPEYNYKWNLNEADQQGDEKILESSLAYRPVKSIQVNFDGGRIDRGSAISSQRGMGQLVLSDSTRLKGEAHYEIISSEDAIQKSDWQRFGGRLGRQVWKLFPYVEYSQQDRQVGDQSAAQTGFYFDEKAAGLDMYSLLGMKWNLESRVREDYLYNPHQDGQRLWLSESFTHQLKMNLLQSNFWQGSMSFVYRNKDFQPFFERLPADSMAIFQPDAQFQDTTWQDRQSHLANLELQYRNKDRTVDSRWDYKVASELLALQEKVFLKVGENRGNYRYDDDLQEYVPDPQGDYLLVVVPTGSYQSITNVVAGWQIRYRPPITREKYSGLKNIFHNISTFTYLNVDEKSREPNIWQLYILNFSKYHSPVNTLRGRYTINQDIYFFERNPDFGITVRNRYQNNLSNQYVDAGYNETTRLWERSASWRQRIWGKKLSQELTYKQILNNREVSAIPSRNRDVFTQVVGIQLNYRPVYAWQLRMDTERGWQNDRSPANLLGVNYWEIRPQVNYSMKGKARGLADFTYLRVDIANNPLQKPIPYEMGKGKRAGNSFLWNLRFEYFVSSNITMTVNYTGRRDSGADRITHLGQAEVRAFF